MATTRSPFVRRLLTHCTRGLRHSATVFLLLSSGGCGHGKELGSAGVDAIQGLWKLELRPDARSHARVSGTVTLAADPEYVNRCPSDVPDCTAVVSGSHTLDARSLGYDLPRVAHATLSRDGTFRFMLGLCCDRGEINGTGSLRGGEIRGHFSRTALTHGHGGDFTLSRIGGLPKR